MSSGDFREVDTMRRLCGQAMSEIEMMKALRAEGWLVILKAIPPSRSYLLPGSRSEYDAPFKSKLICKGKWCAEATWLGDGPYRPCLLGFGNTARKALVDVMHQNAEGRR